MTLAMRPWPTPSTWRCWVAEHRGRRCAPPGTGWRAPLAVPRGLALRAVLGGPAYTPCREAWPYAPWRCCEAWPYVPLAVPGGLALRRRAGRPGPKVTP